MCDLAMDLFQCSSGVREVLWMLFQPLRKLMEAVDLFEIEL